MVKKVPRNAYYFYMMDYRKEEEAKGRKFHRGMGQVADECAEGWKLVPPEIRAKYEQMAANAKLQRKNDPGQKYTSYGETFSEVERKKEEEERRKMKKKQEVEKIVQYLKPESTLRTKSFFLAHVNYFFVNQKDGFHLPAELGICEFSLEKGIINSFHVFIRPCPGSTPLGYAGTIKIHSDKTHKLPLEFPGQSGNYTKIYSELCNFLQGKGANAQGGELPPVYTLNHDEGQNTSDIAVGHCFKYLYDKVHRIDGDEEAWMDQFKVYELSKLFFELKCKTDSFATAHGLTSDELKGRFPQQSLAEDVLRKDLYNYTPKIACNYHENEDNIANCSLSFVRRWVYLICDYCCQDLDIPLIPSFHVPAKADILRPSRTASAISSRTTSRAPSRNAFSEVCGSRRYNDTDNESVVSGYSQKSLDYNKIKSLNKEKPEVAGNVTLAAMRLPKTATAGRGSQILASLSSSVSAVGRGSQILASSSSSAPAETPWRTRTNSETSNTSVVSAKSVDPTKALRMDEREVKNVGKSLANIGIKPVNPVAYQGLEILQGADEIAKAEAEREALLKAQAPPPQPLFTNDSFPSLSGVGRGKRQVSSRGK